MIAMKKILFPISIIALTALFVACEKEIESNEASKEGYTYVFNIGNADAEDNDTKASLGTEDSKALIQWANNDQIGTTAGGTNGYSQVKVSAGTASFSIYSSSAIAVDSYIYCHFPYTSPQAYNSLAMSIPASQTMKSTGFNVKAMPMVSIPFKVESDLSRAGNYSTVGTINFVNLGSLIDFRIYTTNAAYNTETVEWIKFESTALCGDFTFTGAASVDYGDKSTLEIPAVTGTTVTTSFDTPTTVGGDKASAIHAYMVVAPGTHAGTVKVKTNVATYTYNVSSKDFKRAALKPLNVDLNNAVTRELPKTLLFNKVESAPASWEGKYIIVNTDADKVATGAISSSSLASASVTPESSTAISCTEEYAFEFKEVSTGVFSIENLAGKYVGWTGSSTNIELVDALNDNSKYNLEFTSGHPVVTNVGASTRFIRWNGTNVFKMYTSSNGEDIDLYKLSTATAVFADDKAIAYNVTSVEVPYTVFNASGATTVAFNTNPASCASNLSINEGTKKVTFDITSNSGAARTVKVDITNNSVTKTVSITQAAAPSKLVMTSITATPDEDHIEFSWTTVTGATGYAISVNGGVSYGEPQTGLTYDWTGLEPLTTYTLYVKAIGDGDVFYSDSDPVYKVSTTLAATLALPTGLTWTKATKTLSWTDTNTGAGTYGTDYKYVYTTDNGVSTIDASSSTTAVLTITETTDVKVKAIALTSGHRSSAFTDAKTCNIGDALAGIPVSWPITSGTAPTISSNTFSSTATAVGTATLKLYDDSGVQQELTTTTAKTGTGVYNPDFDENWYWLFAIPVENLSASDKIKIQVGTYSNAAQTYSIYYSTNNSTWTDTSKTISSAKSTNVRSASFTTTSIANGTLYIKLVGDSDTSSRLVNEIGFSIVVD